MGIILTDFQGELPGVSNYDLPPNAASEALNCEFGGTVRPARFFSATPDTSTAGWPVKVYGQWFLSDTPNGILPSPMADDLVDRMYRLSAGRLQRALLSAPTSWINVAVESPIASAIKLETVQPTTPYIAEGTPQTPTGTKSDYAFKLMYMGKKSGQTYFSKSFDGFVSGYPNSYIRFEHQPNFQDSINSVQWDLRYNGGWSQAEVDTVRIGLFVRREGQWQCIAYADDADGQHGDNDATPVTGNGNLNAPTITSWVYNETYKMSYSESVYDYGSDSYTTQTTFVDAPPTPVSYTADIQTEVNAGVASRADIPSGEVPMSRAYIMTHSRLAKAMTYSSINTTSFTPVEGTIFTAPGTVLKGGTPRRVQWTSAAGFTVLDEGEYSSILPSGCMTGSLGGQVCWDSASTAAAVEESSPSAPQIVDNIYSNTTVKITVSVPPNPGHIYSVYRASAGVYQYVGDFLPGQTVFEDRVPDAALGEECPSFDWLNPPVLNGIISTGYGFFVGWQGNRIYCSELFLPHAWPSAYSYTAKYNIRRCVAIHNGVLAITDNGNYFISGSSPSGLNLVEMPTFHPCIAANTAVDMGDGVMYVAPTGLALVNASGSQLMTEGAIDANWWAAKNWTDAYAYRMADMYVLVTGAEKWVFNLATKTIARGTGLPARATFDQQTGSMKTPSSVVSPSSFASSYKWVSKVFEFNNGQSYGWTQCIASSYPVSVKWHLWQNDGANTEYIVNYLNHHPVRFPPNRWHMVQAEIVTANPVSKLVLTSDKTQLEYQG